MIFLWVGVCGWWTLGREVGWKGALLMKALGTFNRRRGGGKLWSGKQNRNYLFSV